MMKTSELIRSLIPGQPHPYVPPEHAAQWTSIPPGGLDITPTGATESPPLDILSSLDDRKMVLARNRRCLTDTSERLIKRAHAIKAKMEGETEYWDMVKYLGGFVDTLRPNDAESPSSNPTMDVDSDEKPTRPVPSKVWSLRPRWRTDSGVSPENQMATDIMIPFATDEAAPKYRVSAIARVQPPLPIVFKHEHTSGVRKDSDKSEAANLIPARVVLPTTRRRRLRIILRSQDDSNLAKSTYSTLSCLSKNTKTTGGSDPENQAARDLEDAGEEIFEQEVFDAIKQEARGDIGSGMGAITGVESVVVVADDKQELIFEMVSR